MGEYTAVPAGLRGGPVVSALDVSVAVTEVLIISKDVTGVLFSAKAVTEDVFKALVL